MTLVEAWRERLYSSGGGVAIRTGVGTTETDLTGERDWFQLQTQHGQVGMNG